MSSARFLLLLAACDWGHRCVIFPGTEDTELPARPIGALDRSARWREMARTVGRGRWLGPQHLETSTEYVEFMERVASSERCPDGVDVRALPADCLEAAATPRELHEKLDQWGFDAVTIPHGTTWGTYTPATTSIDKHLDPLRYDGARMRLVEIMSGHGNSEEYRSWQEFKVESDGTPICPEPTADFLPCCWQAGEHERFFAAVTRGAPVEVSAEDGLRAVEIGAAAEQSAKEGRPVGLGRTA